MAKPRKNYGKRPLWQWVVFYLIIGGVIYALIYYSGVIKAGNNNYSTNYDSALYDLVE
ncbi:MAG: hypothetical protein HYW63_01030 [Candidatus Levybacteria bacterium]|nr:hypothetical protein [Candidatus Levybacteria bacterium]